MKKRTIPKRVATASAAVIMSLAMMATCVPAAETGALKGTEDETGQAVNWADNIDEMLEDRQYVEGEAIVIYNNQMKPAVSNDQKEEIGVASGEAAEDTFEGVEVTDKEDAVSVQLVSNEGKTTKELLNELASDPAVISAEPNYLTETPEVPGDGEETPPPAGEDDPSGEDPEPKDDSPVKSFQPSGTRADIIEKQGYEAVGDLSYLQWAYGLTDSEGHYSLHSPSWNTKGSTNLSAEKDWVVAIVDGGIDHTHPDLAPLMVDMTKYNMGIGGKYGYNCSGDGEEDDTMDRDGHGTHCAGIVAASWDGLGTSGVASGVKLCAVRSGDPSGSFADASTAKAFAYLIKACDHGMNLKAVNCSFGGDGSTNVERLMVTELGRRGVVTCYASGNSSKDNDKNPQTSSSHTTNPYALVVNAATPSGQISDYTDFGKDTTHLFSPGDAILAPVSKGEDLNVARYLPSIDPNRKTYDTFASEEDGVQVMYLDTIVAGADARKEYTRDEFISLVSNWKDAGKRVSESESFDKDGCSYEINAQKLKDPDSRSIYLVSVPVKQEDAASISNFGFSVKSTLGKSRVWVRPVELAGDNVSMQLGGSDGWLRPSDVWCSFDVNATKNSTTLPYYNGRIYFFVMLQDVAATSQRSKLYLDCVGGGTDVLRYAFYQGTSMATPAITGSVAVMFERLESEGAFEGLSKQEQAELVVDTMKASTVYNTVLDGKCTSNGVFDFNVKKEDYTPVIHSVQIVDGSTLKIEGKYFGTNGKLYFGQSLIDPKDPYSEGFGPTRQEVLNWTDTEITAHLVGIKVNRLVNVTVITENGKKTQRSFVFNNENGRRIFENEIKMDDAIKNCRIDSLVGLNGKVYLAPQAVDLKYADPVAFDQLWSYDLASGTWKQHKNIPEPEIIHKENRGTMIELNKLGKYIVAHVTYDAFKRGEQPPEGAPLHEDRIYLYNTDKDTWTELDLGKLKHPSMCKVFGTDAGLFMTGGYFFEQDEPTEGEPPSYTQKYSTAIFEIEFDTALVEAGAATAPVKAIRDAGSAGPYPKVAVNQYASIQSIGDSTVILANTTIWLKWSEKDRKFKSEGSQNLDYFEEYSGDSSIGYVINLLGGAYTPQGVIFTGVAGNQLTGRGFDTFYVNKDGSVDAFDRYAYSANLYDSKACYLDGKLIVWGNTFFKQDETFGYMAYTSIEKAENSITVTPSSKTLKAKTLKKKAQSFKMTAKDKAGAKITYAINTKKTAAKAKKYVTVSKAGKVTVKKGTPAGTYLVRINVSGTATDAYKAKTVVKSVKIIVK